MGLAMTGAIAMPFVANAQKYEFDLKNTGAAVVIEQAQPGYPRSSVRKGQEGWVRMSFVVTADGRAIDPIVIDSSGGAGFEREAREAISTWRFETTASGAELPYNVANIRSKIRRGRNSASHTFLRHYRQVAKYLYFEDNDLARNQIDSASNFGGWNLYESTMLWLMLGRVEGVEGNHAGKLEMYRRALGVSTSKSLPRNDRRDLLEKIFGLESRRILEPVVVRVLNGRHAKPYQRGALKQRRPAPNFPTTWPTFVPKFAVDETPLHTLS